MGAGNLRVGGVNLNFSLAFRSGSFDAVNIVEVGEHIDDQPQLIREINRVLKPGGIFLISTLNVLKLMSRMRFLFAGFLPGRIRRIYYSKTPGQAPNIYLLHFLRTLLSVVSLWIHGVGTSANPGKIPITLIAVFPLVVDEGF